MNACGIVHHHLLVPFLPVSRYFSQVIEMHLYGSLSLNFFNSFLKWSLPPETPVIPNYLWNLSLRDIQEVLHKHLPTFSAIPIHLLVSKAWGSTALKDLTLKIHEKGAHCCHFIQFLHWLNPSPSLQMPGGLWGGTDYGFTGSHDTKEMTLDRPTPK